MPLLFEQIKRCSISASKWPLSIDTIEKKPRGRPKKVIDTPLDFDNITNPNYLTPKEKPVNVNKLVKKLFESEAKELPQRRPQVGKISSMPIQPTPVIQPKKGKKGK